MPSVLSSVMIRKWHYLTVVGLKQVTVCSEVSIFSDVLDSLLPAIQNIVCFEMLLYLIFTCALFSEYPSFIKQAAFNRY